MGILMGGGVGGVEYGPCLINRSMLIQWMKIIWLVFVSLLQEEFFMTQF